MRAFGIGLAIALLIGIAIYLYYQQPSAGPSSATPELAKPQISAPPTPLPPKETSPPEPAPETSEQGSKPVTRLAAMVELTSQLHQKDQDPAEDLQNLQTLLFHYRKIFGANPEGGENVIITANLLGKNAKQIAFFAEQTDLISPSGELLDRWSTPYRFHPLSGQEMEIISAGPDRELWTDDDLRL